MPNTTHSEHLMTFEPGRVQKLSLVHARDCGIGDVANSPILKISTRDICSHSHTLQMHPKESGSHQ